MVIVNRKKCTGCGQCASICHEQCIAVVGVAGAGRAAQIDHALCSTCTQCIALCPQQALSWEGVPPAAYDKSRLPAAEQLAELFKQRRTIRRFQPVPVDRALIAEIVGYGIYAPTNHYALRAIVVDDAATLAALDALIMQFVARVYNLVYRSRAVFHLVRRITPLIDAKSKVKMEQGLARGRTYETPPAATVYVVGDRRIMLSEASAQYALYNMILYAQAKGIGSRIKASASISLDRSRAARVRLGLRRREHILAAVELGYPAVRFRNKVEGKRMSIHWIRKGLDGVARDRGRGGVRPLARAGQPPGGPGPAFPAERSLGSVRGAGGPSQRPTCPEPAPRST